MMVVNKEMKSLQKNHTWDLVELLKGRKVVGYKWIFKKESWSSTEEVICYKALVVANDYNQKEGVDYKRYSLQ